MEGGRRGAITLPCIREVEHGALTMNCAQLMFVFIAGNIAVLQNSVVSDSKD